MRLRFAFAGFRHGHITEVYQLAKERNDTIVVAAAEDHKETVASLKSLGIELTHSSVDALFDNADTFDVLAVGDYFGRRGSLTIRALESGKHVLLDKPICTSLKELEDIRQLSRKKNLSVGCQLNLRDYGQIRTLKRLIKEEAIGRVHTINFMGQHPLLYGTRPMWYFEEGKHGGTINDIGIHAVDILPRLLGAPVAEIIAARVWNELLHQFPVFNVGAQLMLRMADETGVIGDVSYTSPDSQGFSVPQYWRFTLHGDKGILETSLTVNDVKLWQNGAKEVKVFELDPERKGGYLEDFIDEIGGTPERCDLTTDQVLDSARVALLAQKAADEKLTYVRI